MRFKYVITRRDYRLAGGESADGVLAGHWSIRSHVDAAIREALDKAAHTRSAAPFKELIDGLSELGEVCRFYGCIHEILEAYTKVQYDVFANAGARGSAISDLVAQVDRSEFCYNLGVLWASVRDYDAALSWFAEADAEEVRRRGQPAGSTLRGLIDDNDSPFWNFASNIQANCSNFMPGVFGQYEFMGVFGRNMHQDEFKAILNDLSMPLFLEFFHSMLSYWKSFSSTNGVVRFVRLSRLVGELCHVLDCYLGDQGACAGRGAFFDKLSAIVQSDAPLKQEFERVHAAIGRGVTITEVNTQFRELADLIEREPAGPKKWAYCLLAAHRMRNYSAHDMDDGFILNLDPLLAKKVFLAVLMSFFVSRKLLGAWVL
jgi:hypothetical protein